MSGLTQHHPINDPLSTGGTADGEGAPAESGGTKREDGHEPGHRQRARDDGDDEQGNAGEDPGHPQPELPFLMGAAEPLAHGYSQGGKRWVIARLRSWEGAIQTQATLDDMKHLFQRRRI